MTCFQNILLWFSLVAAGVLSAVGFAVWCDRHQAFPGRRLLGAFRRLPWPVQFFLLAFSLHMIVYGSVKTNAVGGVEGTAQQRGRDIPVACNKAVSTFPSRGRNAASPLYEVPHPELGRVPPNAELAQNWWRRGCWEDWRPVAFEDGWVFPHGSNHLSQVVVMSQGEVLASICDTLSLASLGAKVAHVPFDTCFTQERTPSNSYRFVWDRAYVNRDTNTPMTAVVELFRNGNYTVTTNGCIAEQFVREPPFPRDGIGQDDDWVRANFTNATDILAVGYANWVDAQVGVDLTNGLYKFTVTFPDDPPEATELIVGDLSVCVTNAGEYVFVLEKGVEYDFGTNPYDATVEYSMQDDLMDAPVFANGWWGDGNGVWTVDGDWHELCLPWLTYLGSCYWEPKFCGSPDVAYLGVSDFPMTFEAVLTDCCRTNGITYKWSTSTEGVRILSPNSRVTQVEVDALPSWDRFSLTVDAYLANETLTSTIISTYGTNSSPQVSLSIAAPDALLVNDDGDVTPVGKDCEVPGRHVNDDDIIPVTVSWHSDIATNGTLVIGTLLRDGHLWKDENRSAEISLEERIVLSDARDWSTTLYLECEYESYRYRSEQISATWTDGTSNRLQRTHSFTALNCVAEPITSERIAVDGVEYILNPCCAIIGANTYLKIGVTPEDVPDDKITWRILEGVATFPDGNRGRNVTVVAGGADGDAVVLEVDIDGCVGGRPRFELLATEMKEVLIYPYLVAGAEGAALSHAQLAEKLNSVNMIYRQVGLHFSSAQIEVIDNYEWSDLGLARKSVGRAIRNYAHKTDGVEVYFIAGEADLIDYDRKALGRANSEGIVICCKASGIDLAHEIGHVASLADIYVDEACDEQHSSLRKTWMPNDWNNGTGSRFYAPGECPIDLLPKLMMFGVVNDCHVDIPAGPVRGFVEDSRTHLRSLGNAAVGRSAMLIYPPHTK